MLRFLRGVLDRALLIGAVVVGGLVPGYIAQYRQRLGGSLDQARLDLEPWQRIADQFHQGDLGKLIRYHLDSSDPTFHSEGQAIQALVNAVQRLQAAMEAMQGSLIAQAKYLLFHADPALARATLSDWVPTFALSVEGIAFALVFAMLLWLLFHALWWLFALAFSQGSGGRRVPGHPKSRAWN
jgi:hypothetical protein